LQDSFLGIIKGKSRNLKNPDADKRRWAGFFLGTTKKKY
jgi:hypothetical protein